MTSVIKIFYLYNIVQVRSTKLKLALIKTLANLKKRQYLNLGHVLCDPDTEQII